MSFENEDGHFIGQDGFVVLKCDWFGQIAKVPISFPLLKVDFEKRVFMAVDKLAGPTTFPNFMTILSSRESLEEALARFDEQVTRHSPDVIRKRLKKRLCNLRVNINGNDEEL